ncbi:tetratricopeptide repeat protein [Neorhizobium sp. P12A]|uniref:tetratricopeptide repeat protein n=1 Tax=Neorhizobium sp. P12A TaxID=2268027 RepID=UPI0011F07754|nr:tetratricopeptide repeat protein [Neorhizobium sp. P12A]KAA0695650.1 tetratricopeptide repeat protein [Neorhizobium sp. P12A]
MKLSFILLSVAVIGTAAFVGLKNGERIAEWRDRILGSSEPVQNAQLMRMGRISGPDFSSLDRKPSDQQELAQADQAQSAPDAQQDAKPRAEAIVDQQTTAPADADASAVAQANPQPAAPAPAGTPTQANAQQPTVDESALRYFASRGDKARLQAEISRLRALYPTWTPPTDPLAVPQNRDQQLEAMWQLYSESRYADLRKAIANRQAAEAGWQPPADLLDRLSVAEARAHLITASDQKQYEMVVQLGAATPSLLTCSEVDVLWRVAEAFAHTDRLPRARDAYVYILKNCDNPSERLATVQKASALLPYTAMQDLVALERPLPNGSREFDAIRDDLARRFVAEANDDPKLVISPDYLSRVEQIAQTQGLASDALLLGWYSLRREDMPTAEKWFRAARAKEDTASASQGVALTLIARKSPQEAEDVMYRWRDASKDATSTYLAATANLLALDPAPALQPEILQRIAAVVLKESNVPTAQQFGWYARTLKQFPTAAQWFETALRWKPDDEPSAYGLAITRQQLNDKAGVAEIQRLWAGHSARIEHLGEVEQPKQDQRIPLPRPNVDGDHTQAIENLRRVEVREPSTPAIYNAPQSPEVSGTAASRSVARVVATRTSRPAIPQGCSTTIDPETLPPAAALPRGWCLMNLNRPTEAAAAFDVALRSNVPQAREDAAYGQSLAYLRLGLSNQAAVSAAKAPQNRQRALELQTAILTNRATNAFGTKRYREAILYLDQLRQIQPERIDLMVLRGYAYLNMKRYPDAIRIFEAAAETGNHDAITALSNAREAQKYPND